MASFAFTGNILGEATNPLGNNLLEAMRHQIFAAYDHQNHRVLACLNSWRAPRL